MGTNLSAQFSNLLGEYGAPDGVSDSFATVTQGIPTFP